MWLTMTEGSSIAWNPSGGITLYGRKPALEAILDTALEVSCLHLADSNRTPGVIAQIIAGAERRGIPIRFHSRQALSRISKNGRQDQGVALDVVCPTFTTLEQLIDQRPDRSRLLALDGITNPQNVGMIIRSAVAAGIDGLLYPRRGVSALGPLVIKASAGTVFRAPIIWCESAAEATAALKNQGYHVVTLEADAPKSLFEYHPSARTVCVLGGETDGVSAAVTAASTERVAIPMSNQVESLNVAVTAALVAFHITAAHR